MIVNRACFVFSVLMASASAVFAQKATTTLNAHGTTLPVGPPRAVPDFTPVKKENGFGVSYRGEVSIETKSLITVMMDGAKIRRNKARTKTGSKAATASTGRCSMFIAIGLTKAGCTENYTCYRAKDCDNDLTKQGFEKVTDYKTRYKTLYDVPPGAIIVYSPTDGTPNGHIEMRTETGFVSDYASPKPRPGVSGAWSSSSSGRKVKAILVKPSCGAGVKP